MEILPPVEADDNRINAEVAGHIPADHELTTLVDAMFGPEAGPHLSPAMHQDIKGVVHQLRSARSIVLEQVEVRLALLVQGDERPVDDGIVGKVMERLCDCSISAGEVVATA
jgi:hypothetical protein